MATPTRRSLLATGVGSIGVAGIGMAAFPSASHAEGDAGLMWVQDRAVLRQTSVSRDVAAIVVTRYDRDSPVCPARYERATGDVRPTDAHSRDGAVWRMAEPVIDIAMFGTGGDAIHRALASLAGRPGIVRLSAGRYRIKVPIRLRSGQSLIGAGWASLEDAGIADGSTVIELDGADAAIDIIGDLPMRPIERVRVGGLAILGQGKGSGIRLRDARHFEIEDIYLTRLDRGIFGEATVWMGKYSRLQCFACKIGFDLNSGTEDSIFSSCIVRYADIACRINYHAQTNYFVGCDFGYARISVQLIGSIGKRVNATFESCIFEFKPTVPDGAAVFELTGPVSRDISDYPSVSCRSCRFHALAETADAPIFLIRRANKISVTDCRGGGQMGTTIRSAEGGEVGSILLSGNETLAKVVGVGDRKFLSRLTAVPETL